MLIVRPARWPDDQVVLERLDISFTTDRTYRVLRDPFAFRLVEERVEPPLRKDYGPVSALGITGAESAFVAECDGAAAGLAVGRYERWNRRFVVEHLYVDPGHRGQGVGRALMEHLAEQARIARARCVWVETQDVNYPAIRFYLRVGFRLCGLDESLYDPDDPSARETALFFVRELE